MNALQEGPTETGEMGTKGKKNGKERLDILLVQKGLAPSREKARALIMAGIVYVNDSYIEYGYFSEAKKKIP